MITPEPIPPPRAVVTLTCTTEGCTFEITASRTASILLPLLLTGGMVGCGLVPGCNVPTALPLPRPNSQPAPKSKPPKSTASSNVNNTVRPVREGRCGGGVVWTG